MKQLISVMSVFAMVVTATVFGSENVRIKGAAPGEWTMDLDAAKKVAAEKKLPIMLDFSGSDWCGWCKLMDRNVFQQPEWNAYATNNIMTVLLDFPNDKSLVPSEYVKRNADLMKKYGVGGYPTYIILESDGKTEAGRLSADRDKTPAGFIAEINKIFQYREKQVAEYIKNLKKEDADKYLAIVKKINDSEKLLSDKKDLVWRENQNITKLEEDIEKFKADAAELRVAVTGEEKLKEYKRLRKNLDEMTKSFNEWVASKPEHTQENFDKYKASAALIEELKAQLSEF